MNLAIESEQQFGPDHVAETVGYFTIDAGTGTWNSMPFVVGESFYITSSFRNVFFSGVTFDAAPSFLASMLTYHGFDNAHLRFTDLDIDSVMVKVEEDTTADAEMGHSNENVGYLAIGGQGSLTAVTRTVTDGGTNMFTFDVAETGRVVDLDVHLDLVHTRVSDLTILLEAPDGTVVELLSDVGGTGDDLTGTIFDDDATQSIVNGTAPFTGEFQPEGLLRDFTGTDINGTWTLTVTDSSLNRNTGALLDWFMEIELARKPEGNLNYDDVVDAEDIDLLFANLGSTDPTYDLNGSGNVDTNDVDRLVQTIMERRYGDSDLDQNIDSMDLDTTIGNFDPVGSQAFHSWIDGNFDGDNDVDISDVLRVVTGFSPTGYQSVTNQPPNHFSYFPAVFFAQNDTVQSEQTRASMSSIGQDNSEHAVRNDRSLERQQQNEFQHPNRSLSISTSRGDVLDWITRPPRTRPANLPKGSFE